VNKDLKTPSIKECNPDDLSEGSNTGRTHKMKHTRLNGNVVHILKFDLLCFVSSIVSAMSSETPKTELDSHADLPVECDNVEIVKYIRCRA